MQKGSYNILDFGAVPDGQTMNTKQIEHAINSCYTHGGGTVTIPAGNFLTGAIQLKSNVHLLIEAGAILQFTTDVTQYPIIHSRWEGVDQLVYASCIYAQDATHIAVTGHGRLQGNGAAWWEAFRANELAYPRPKLISFDRCEHVTIRDIYLENAPSWTVHPLRCKNVAIHNITIVNPADSPNTDGINPESSYNVRISDCSIDVGDDCIAIKAGTEDAEQSIPCENITITNCTMMHGHGGIVLGSEMSGDIRNITVSNCIFEGTDRGIRLKSRRGRGGIIEDIRISNIYMRDVICPFIFNLYYYHGPRGLTTYVSDKQPHPVTTETPQFRNIHLANITAREVHAAAGFLYGLPEMPVKNITFTHVDITMAENAVPGYPAMMMDIEKMAKRGFICRNVQDIKFIDVTVNNQEGAAFDVEPLETVTMSQCVSNAQLLPLI